MNCSIQKFFLSNSEEKKNELYYYISFNRFDFLRKANERRSRNFRRWIKTKIRGTCDSLSYIIRQVSDEGFKQMSLMCLAEYKAKSVGYNRFDFHKL